MRHLIITFLKKLLNSITKKTLVPTESPSYDDYWSTHPQSWTYGINIIDKCLDLYKPNKILDAGCGQGDVVTYLLSKGFHAVGCDVSDVGVQKNNPHLLQENRFYKTTLSKLPFENNSFDLIFCSEVLEHIPEEEIQATINEFYRVTNNIAFLTISLRPSSENNKYHCTLRPRIWWEDHFIKAGFIKETEAVNTLQITQRELNNLQVLKMGPTKAILHEMKEFIENPPYDFNGELEPWFFVFRK